MTSHFSIVKSFTLPAKNLNYDQKELQEELPKKNFTKS